MSVSDNDKPSGSINRRDVLKIVSLVPAAAIAPGAAALAAPTSPASAGPSQAQAGSAAEAYEPRVLNPHQWKTVGVLSDLIIPADEQSGSATDAGVPAFIDDFVGLKGERAKTMVDGGLAWLDWRTNRDFGHDFVDCSEAQQKEILDRLAFPDKAKPGDEPGVVFFAELRSVVMEGFYSSKMGIEDLKYIGNKMNPDWQGCPEEVTERLGVDYSHWEHWS